MTQTENTPNTYRAIARNGDILCEVQAENKIQAEQKILDQIYSVFIFQMWDDNNFAVVKKSVWEN